MKKNLLSLLLLLIASASYAQNIQLHYDLGRNIYPDEEAGRQKVTATIEQFKADKLGSWFYFVDLDFTRKGVMGAYTEISREFNLGTDCPFAAHVEYDGGLQVGENNIYGSKFQPATLLGVAWNGHNADFSTTYSVQLMYKRFFTGADGYNAYNSAQLTGVWSTTFANKACTFSGFIDFWRGENAYNGHGQLVMLAEPQLWYNANSNFSIGTEVEVSNNFIFNTFNDKSFFINPTIALKYAF